MSTPHRIILTLFLLLMLAGQVINQPGKTFPFVRWDMYGRPENSLQVHFFEYVGFDASGEKVLLNPVRLFPTLRHGRLVLGLERRLVNARLLEERSQRDAFFKEKKGIDAVLIAIASQFNQRHPDHAIERLEVSLNFINRYSKSDPAVTQDIIWSVHVQ